MLTAFGHFGSDLSEDEFTPRVQDALATAGIPATMASSGTTIGGGTPAHRWLEVTLEGQGTGLKVLAGTEEELAQELARVATSLGLPSELLDADRPPGWPVTGLFGLG